jgi:hypothetical protein
MICCSPLKKLGNKPFLSPNQRNRYQKEGFSFTIRVNPKTIFRERCSK